MQAFSRSLVAAAAVVLAAACGFSPTSPFEGFDGKGSRVSGSFDSSVAALGEGAAAAASGVQGIQVSLRENGSLSTTVGGNGTFALAGVPTGSFTLLFLRGGGTIGEMRFQNVRPNQEIRIVVSLTVNGEVVLLEEQRDQVPFAGSCPRGAGFWCQNQGGKNPNLSAEEFRQFAEEAASMLSSVPALDTPEEVAAAVCNTGDQLLRQLATLALNLAADTLELSTPLVNETGYATVGDAFNRALQVATSGSSTDRNQIKDVLERINENHNTDVCEPDDDDDDVPPTTGTVTICHIPPGNPAARHTITIGASAWPAHQAHGDTMGPCQ